MIIKSKRIIGEDKIINGYLIVENGMIKQILPEKAALKADLDVGNNRIMPGFLDTHNHGTMGYTLMGKADEREIKGYLKGLASQGVTSIFPTCDIELINLIAKMADEKQDGAKIVGIHSEGPWLNRVGEKGTKTGYPDVDIKIAQKMIDDGLGKLKLVAIAPEIPGSEKLIKLFLENGIHVGYAHSDLQYEEANRAIDLGIDVATHLANVMTGLHHRDIGGFGACLLRDEVTCELICDGLHVSLPMIQLIMKMKDNQKIMMISDSTPMAGAQVGKYNGFGPGMEEIFVNEEGFVLNATGRLCGSSQGIIYGVKNLVEKLGVSEVEVAKLSSLNAFMKYHLADHKGSLSTGKDADFIIIDDDYKVLKTFSEGRKVFDIENDTNIFNPKFYEEFLLK
ncbi:MAG: N-acetylglucosamine-6-phosphate deacetylase [Bacilli bacterium]